MKPWVMLLVGVVAFVTAFSGWALENEFEGRVIHVDDGDTVILLMPGHERVVVRLSDIDAPELSHGHGRPGQPFSSRSKETLSRLILGQNVRARCYEKDRYGRSVCQVKVGDLDVNAEQIRKGMAWANRASSRYVRDTSNYEIEAHAKAAGIGLWSDDRPPTPPWVWRRDCWKSAQCAGHGE